MLRRFALRLRNAIRPAAAERDLEREVATHLALLEQEFVRRGMTAGEASHAARRALGGVERTKELHRDARSFTWLDDTRRDVRQAARALVREPGFAAVVVLTMALGIGATATLFSIVYNVLLQPLPWPDADRVVRLEERRGGSAGRIPRTISNATYHAWREQPSTIEEIGGWLRSQLITVGSVDGTTERLQIGRVTPSLLRVLNVPPLAGRLLADADAGGPAGTGAILISAGLWQRRFGGQSDVLGTSVRLDGNLFTIVGIMPPDFSFPEVDTEAWLPMQVSSVDAGGGTISAMIFGALARLRPGVGVDQAAAEGTARAAAAPSLASAALALFGSTGKVTITAMPARDAMTADVERALFVLLAAVALLFVAATASVLVLQSARAVRRRREMAIRTAIGAGTGRLARAWLAESACLGVAGGIVGLLLAALLHSGLPSLLPPGFPRAHEIGLNGAVAIVVAALACVISLASGLLPIAQTHTTRIGELLSEDSGSTSWHATRSRAARVRAVLLVAQVAIACVLLVGSGLLGRSFAALLSADRGFDPRHVLTAHVTMPREGLARRRDLFERVQARLRALPGVTHAGFGDALPFVTIGGLSGMSVPSPTNPGATIQIQTVTRTVSPDYFPAMGLRIVEGRPLRDSDTASSPLVIVVNRTFARQYLGPNAVGTALPVFAGGQRSAEVVGVVDDMRQGGMAGGAPPVFGGVGDPPQPEMFFSYRQRDPAVSDMAFVVRGASDPIFLAPTIRTVLRDEDSSLTLASLMTMEDRVMNSLARPRTYAVLLAGFAAFALMIAAVGLYGALSYATAQRTREIGVRTALGAQPGDILRLFGSQAAAMTCAGVAVGLGAAAWLAQGLSALLYGVSPRDAATFAAVPAVLVLVALAACIVPARRAARVDPLVALRT